MDRHGRKVMRSSAVLALALALCACSGAPDLKPDTPTGVNLAGTWRLNRQASQDPQAMIDAIRQKFMRARRDYVPSTTGEEMPEIDEHGNPRQTRRGGMERGGMERGPADPAAIQRRAKYAPGASYTRALGAALTADSMKIEQSATRFAITRGDDRRSFTPGGDSVISVEDGVADQYSGWSGKEYVIEVKPQVGPRVIERYGLSADGRQLVEKFALSEDGLPKLEFTRVYDAGALSPRTLPTSN
jgi:hypothetical protein